MQSSSVVDVDVDVDVAATVVVGLHESTVVASQSIIGSCLHLILNLLV